MNNLKLKIFCTLTLSICLLYANGQFICNVSNRSNVVSNSANYEFSGLAYHTEINTFFMPLDDPIGGYYIRGYDAENADEFNVGLEGSISNPDFEGLTYLEGNYFALVDETSRVIYFLEYINDFANRRFKILSSHNTGISLFDNDGLEGLSYNPHNNTLYAVREMDYRLYSIPLDLPNNNFEGEIKLNEISNVQLPENLFNGACASGIFHLGKNFDANNPLSNNILVLSHELKKVFEFELVLNAGNNLTSNSINYINQTTINSEPQAEGIVVVDNAIYIASEKQSGGLSQYTVKYENESCSDSDPYTSNDTVDEFCNCVGVQEQICPPYAVLPINANNENDLQSEYVSSFFVVTATSNEFNPIDVVVRNNQAVDLKGCDITLNGGFVVEAGGILNATIDPCE